MKKRFKRMHFLHEKPEKRVNGGIRADDRVGAKKEGINY
jgi:hypothetical protein